MGKYPGFEYWAERVAAVCRNLLGASAGCVSILGRDGKDAEVVFSASEGAECTAETLSRDPVRRLRNSALRSGRAVCRNDIVSTSRNLLPGKKGAAVDNVLLAPMMIDGKIVGFLSFLNKPGGFRDEDARVAVAFGEIASIAFQNSRALEALRESETKYRIIADNTNDWEWWMAADSRFIYMSPSCQRITGHDPAEFSSEPDLIQKVVHPDDRAVFAAHRKEVDRTLRGGNVEFRIVRPDGTHRWVAHVCQPVFDETGRFLGHRGSNRDVTERKEAEEALRRSEETLRELSAQLLRAQEEGRKRVARELHDGVNQTLTAIKFALESRLSHMTAADAAPGPSFEKIVSLVQHAIDETRRIQMDLRPPVLDDLGILATLSWFTREFQNVYGHIRIEKSIEATEEEIPHLLKIVIFRIVQEALNNVAKHSRADLARLALKSAGGAIELTIQDNGRGFDLEKAAGGFGLISMRERAELSGGTFEIKTAAGRGTTIKAAWPPRQL